MQTVLVFCHPRRDSYNGTLLSAVTECIEKKGRSYKVIDLYADGFDPRLDAQDLVLYEKGQTTDGKVKGYQKMLKASDELIIIAPIWWYELPAIFKGFLDKVLLPGFAYERDKNGDLVGKLTNIKRTTIITTSEAPAYTLLKPQASYVRSILMKGALTDIGLKNIIWKHIGNMNSPRGEKKRKDFLVDIKHHFTMAP
ncbi:NAD(P)H-dependent oxidoreductase [Parasphaerochaeta coccoides]|uniref:NAD(P)H dehydrogenase (Quinone) n=1 Tax=Parasphaerochaeta coccoides (strain ATCC BAA-1237 / DSM 17374 / SPN1) TaxID=760011 RepID=F4GIQ3_PARC1|nr:NAD(P)H-dependent oxidoreductase [Parasphaerochaeta coccoides]AEC02187.1 NAD(P)H dehydrogenase (quinone) [Parasphaerochaeta coccoides DSM 17374]